MTGNYKTERFDKEHRHFGGLIYQSDFCTEYRNNVRGTNGSITAKRIAEDFEWEQKLRKLNFTNKKGH